MTSKELLYVEDALGHAKYLETCCRETANQLSDPELKNYVEQMAQKHAACYTKFYSLLG